MNSHVAPLLVGLMLVLAGCGTSGGFGSGATASTSPSPTAAPPVTGASSTTPVVTPTCGPDSESEYSDSKTGVPLRIESHHNPSHTVTVTIAKVVPNQTTAVAARYNQTVQVDSSVRSSLRTDGTVFTEAGDYRVALTFHDVNRTVATTLTVGDNLTVSGWRRHALIEVNIEPEGYEQPEFAVAFDVWFHDRPSRDSQQCD